VAQAVNPEGPRGQGGAARRRAAAAAGPAAAADAERRSWLAHMRGDARASAAELLTAWLADWHAQRLRHTPASLVALVQVACSGTLALSPASGQLMPADVEYTVEYTVVLFGGTGRL
jgi:hypothetical protein